MAHFAKIEDGIVTNVLVVDNEHEANGEAYLNSLGIEGTWVQTSYNATIRGKFAAIGDAYHEDEDVFKPVKPYSTWTWDEPSWSWKAPKVYPPLEDPEDTNVYSWNDETEDWEVTSA